MPSVDFYDAIQLALMVLLSFVGMGVRALHKELTGLRVELHRYVTQEACKAHRMTVENEIQSLKMQLERFEDDGK